MRNAYTDMGLTLQPLLFVIDDNAGMVAIDHYRWCYDNIVKALDIVFKLIQVLYFIFVRFKLWFSKP